MKPRRFTTPVRPEDLADLHERLDRTRWAEGLPGWAWGTDPTTLRELVHVWRHEFDWPARAAALDRILPASTVELDGMQIHFARRRGIGPRPLPIVLLHGWPSSFTEMVVLAELLADPAAHGGHAEDAFDVVVPSLPGHGYSSVPPHPEYGADDAAGTIRRLMLDVLGFEHFAAHGGDRGSFVATSLGALHPDVTVGIHLTFPGGLAADPPTADDTAWFGALADYVTDEGGYMAIQGTRPQSLGYGLNDSPAGLLAWLVEKWRAWSDCDGDLLRAFTTDEILTNASIYWFTQSIRPSMQWYWAHRVAPPASTRPVRVDCPTAVAMFPGEIVRAPRSVVERKYRLEQWTDMPRGGHFAQLEAPHLLADDIRAFFRDRRGREPAEH